MHFLDDQFDKILIASLIVFFGFMSFKLSFAPKECDILIGCLTTLLVQKFRQGTPPPQ